MSNSWGTFVDTIPDIQRHLGISNRNYLKVAVRQAETYGYKDAAAWFKSWEEKFERCVKGEWNVGDTEIKPCTIGGQDCFCRTYGIG